MVRSVHDGWCPMLHRDVIICSSGTGTRWSRRDKFTPQSGHRSSSVTMVSRLHAGRPELNSRQGKWWDSFSSPPHSDWRWEPSNLLSNGHRGLFPRGRVTWLNLTSPSTTLRRHMGEGGIAPRILNVGAGRRRVVSFRPRPLYPTERDRRYPLDKRLGGPHSRSERWGEQKKFLPSPCWGSNTDHPAHSLVAILTEVTRLSTW
jgi:hypothetical protein